MSPVAEFLHRIEPHAEWYSEDEQGAVQLKAAQLRHDNRHFILSAAARVALALTELCCERRKGKVSLSRSMQAISKAEEGVRFTS